MVKALSEYQKMMGHKEIGHGGFEYDFFGNQSGPHSGRNIYGHKAGVLHWLKKKTARRIRRIAKIANQTEASGF